MLLQNKKKTFNTEKKRRKGKRCYYKEKLQGRKIKRKRKGEIKAERELSDSQSGEDI